MHKITSKAKSPYQIATENGDIVIPPEESIVVELGEDMVQLIQASGFMTVEQVTEDVASATAKEEKPKRGRPKKDR